MWKTEYRIVKIQYVSTFTIIFIYSTKKVFILILIIIIFLKIICVRKGVGGSKCLLIPTPYLINDCPLSHYASYSYLHLLIPTYIYSFLLTFTHSYLHLLLFACKNGKAHINELGVFTRLMLLNVCPFYCERSYTQNLYFWMYSFPCVCISVLHMCVSFVRWMTPQPVGVLNASLLFIVLLFVWMTCHPQKMFASHRRSRLDTLARSQPGLLLKKDRQFGSGLFIVSHTCSHSEDNVFIRSLTHRHFLSSYTLSVVIVLMFPDR